MIKVHCFVSCVCEIIKRTPGVDHRPFYFGVWDADFSVSAAKVLSYHSPHTRHEDFRNWYRQLYGIQIHEWFDAGAPKDQNIATLNELLYTRPTGRQIMVMLDMYRLPERENKFQQNPFPHYVMLETTDNPEEWYMSDPDFRWEGILPRATILDSIRSPAAAGGFYFDDVNIRHSSDETVAAYFAQCMKNDNNPFTEGLRDILRAHLGPEAFQPLNHLSLAFREIPVMAIRKYAYEHAFAWFLEQRGEKVDENNHFFEGWCDEIETLVKTYTRIQFRAMKLVMSGDPSLVAGIEHLLDEQDAREFRIKRALTALFEEWWQRSDTAAATATGHQLLPEASP